jgi:hypothetical protein
MKQPLRYQITEYDCGPTSLLNAVSFLFGREDIPPELVRNIMLYSLDTYGADGVSGKSGTSHTAMLFLSHWLDGFGRAGRLPIRSEYLTGRDVTLGSGSRIVSALRRGGAAVVRLDLDGWHYVLLTGIEGEGVRVFDPYYQPDALPAEVRAVQGHDAEYNRIVPREAFETEEIRPYGFGPCGQREAVLLYNCATELTEENTVEYMI